MRDLGVCWSCGAAVVWAWTESGKIMPVDPAPHPAGNLVLTRAGGFYHARVDPDRPGQKYRTHFASCPDAAQHRRSRNRRNT